jgi:hypothetical protein
MISYTLFTRAALRLALAAVPVAALVAGCSSERFLASTDPDLIQPGDLQSAAGAEALRLGALGRFTTSMTRNDAGGEGALLQSGLLADEWKSGNTFTETITIDQRNVSPSNAAIEESYRNLNRARVAAIQAITALNAFVPPSTSATASSNLGQMYFVKGFTELMMAETYCSGVAFSDASQATGPLDVKFGPSLTTAEALNAALATLDSAVFFAATTDTLATKIRSAARIARARALLGLNRYADARNEAASVTTFQPYTLTYLQTSGDNGIWSLNNSQRRYTVSDSADPRVGRVLNAIPFVSANDKRVPTRSNGASFETTIPNVAQQIWAVRDASVQLIQPLDARLIEAEAQLKNGEITNYFATMNALRTAIALPNLVDPVDPTARVSQFFREKAFFQFGRGTRLGDLRRLIRQYGRTQDQVFPAGEFHQGGQYGVDVNFPLPQAEQNNSTRPQCIDRNA